MDHDGKEHCSRSTSTKFGNEERIILYWRPGVQNPNTDKTCTAAAPTRTCVRAHAKRPAETRSTELAGVPVRRSIHLISRRTIQGELALGASLAWLGPSPSRPCYDGRDNANNWCEDPLKKMVRGGNGQGRESCSSPWTWTG